MKKKPVQKYDNVVDMLRDLVDDDFANELEERIQSQAIINSLVGRRIAKGMSQSDVAQHLDCSQSRISKIEAGTDAELRLDELMAYGRALGMEFEILAHPLGTSSVDRVKTHAACIQLEMQTLAERKDAGNELPKRPAISLQLVSPHEELLSEPLAEVTSKPRQRARRKEASKL